MRKGNEFVNIEMTRFAGLPPCWRNRSEIFSPAHFYKHGHGRCLHHTTKPCFVKWGPDKLLAFQFHIWGCWAWTFSLCCWLLRGIAPRNSSVFSWLLEALCVSFGQIPPDSIWFVGPQLEGLEGVTCNFSQNNFCSFRIWQLFLIWERYSNWFLALPGMCLDLYWRYCSCIFEPSSLLSIILLLSHSYTVTP